MARTASFEQYVERYDSWFERNRAAYLSELEALKRLINNFDTALEIGVGTARFALPLGVQYGVDPAKRMVEVARSRGVEVVRAIAERLPFKDSTFDLVLMVTTICFLDDVDSSFDEVRRVLRRKGKFIIGFIDRESLLGRRIRATLDNPFYTDATLYSVGEVVGYLERKDFEVLRFAQTIFDYPENISKVGPVKNGFGEGSFVAVKAQKL